MAGVGINTLTMEQYLTLLRENQATGVVKLEIEDNVNFDNKSQFMCELREDTFSGNKNEDAHDYIDRVLSIIGLFNIPKVSKDAVLDEVPPKSKNECHLEIKLISEEYTVNAQNESNLSITSNDINMELSNEFLMELQKSAYHRWIDEDVVNHIAKNGYPESYDGEEEMLDKGDNGIDPLEFISWNKRRMDDKILSSNNTTTESFFKPYLITLGKCDTKKEDEQS
ncbi:hypothetical protein Tco_1447495 [Tanacetum coccineum]